MSSRPLIRFWYPIAVCWALYSVASTTGAWAAGSEPKVGVLDEMVRASQARQFDVEVWFSLVNDDGSIVDGTVEVEVHEATEIERLTGGSMSSRSFEAEGQFVVECNNVSYLRVSVRSEDHFPVDWKWSVPFWNGEAVETGDWMEGLVDTGDSLLIGRMELVLVERPQNFPVMRKVLVSTGSQGILSGELKPILHRSVFGDRTVFHAVQGLDGAAEAPSGIEFSVRPVYGAPGDGTAGEGGSGGTGRGVEILALEISLEGGVHGDGVVGPLSHRPDLVVHEVLRELQLAPTEGYTRKARIGSTLGEDAAYFYVRLFGHYGKARVPRSAEMVRAEGSEGMISHIEIWLNEHEADPNVATP